MVTALASLAAACGVAAHVELLAAVVRVESGGDTLALAVNGAFELARAPRDRADAERMARWLAAHAYSFDAGLAQVNSANFARLGLDARNVFEPCANLRAAETVLRECLGRAEARGLIGVSAIRAALSCYNTGDLQRGIQNGYAGAVLAVLRASPAERRLSRLASSGASASFPEDARRPEVFALASAKPPHAVIDRSARSPQHP